MKFVRSRYGHVRCAEREDSRAILCRQDHPKARDSQCRARVSVAVLARVLVSKKVSTEEPT